MSHVLIIEDDTLFSGLLKRLILSEGAKSVDIAASQSEAMRSAKHSSPDFICSDFGLLDGNGVAAVREIRAAHGPIPALYISGSPEMCKPLGAGDRLLVKPVTATAISKAIRALLPA
jgi:DNA-binding response OmpR family regulator